MEAACPTVRASRPPTAIQRNGVEGLRLHLFGVLVHGQNRVAIPFEPEHLEQVLQRVDYVYLRHAQRDSLCVAQVKGPWRQRRWERFVNSAHSCLRPGAADSLHVAGFSASARGIFHNSRF